MSVFDAQELPALLKGEITAQFVRCGKPNCRCSRGELHGPYFYRVWRDGEKICRQYVSHWNVESVRQACRAYGAARIALRQNRQAQDALKRSIRRTWQVTRKSIAQGDSAG